MSGMNFRIFILSIAIIFSLSNIAFSKITIIDDTGYKVMLKRPALRIVSLYGGITETVCALGFCERLVGVTKRDWWPREVQQKTKVGTHMRPNLEIILGLKPDLVIQGSVRPGSQIIVEKLRAMSIPVAIFNPVDFDSLFSEMKRIGILCGDEKGALHKIGMLKKQLFQIRKSLPLSKRPKVIFEVSYPSLLVAGEKNFVTDIINMAGGINPVKKDKKLVKLSLEAIISLSPDVYIIQKGPMNHLETPPTKRPNFSTIMAVKNGRILIVDEFLFSRPTPRSVKAVKTLREYLYKIFPKK